MNAIVTGTSVPTVFNFNSNEVRTVEIDNQIWFVATDVAQALEYRDAANAVRILDADEVSTHIVSTPSINQHGDIGTQETTVTIINESGLYSLILKSRKPSAKVFKKWVTSDVLPSIRKTGAYTAPVAPITINPAQQNALQQIVTAKVGDSGGLRAYVWSRFNNHFHLGSYKQLPAEYFEEAKAYLATLPMKAGDKSLSDPNPPSAPAVPVVPMLGTRILMRLEAGGRYSSSVVAEDAMVFSLGDLPMLLGDSGSVPLALLPKIMSACAERLAGVVR